MNIENMYRFSDNDKMVNMPVSTYCSKCDLLMKQGEVARRFDAATFYHLTCPTLPMKSHSITRRLFNETGPDFQRTIMYS